VRERLIEDWLTKVNERGFEIPFCQTLVAKGHRILRVGHSPFEDGKDVISLDSKDRLHAYQLKGGAFDLSAMEEHMAQIRALVETSVSHPRVKSGTPHLPFFVTTGAISQPALHRVENLNASFKSRKLPALTLIGGQELLRNFAELSDDFWPIDPPKERAFLTLYLAEGKGDLDKPELAKFLQDLLTVPAKTPKTKVARRISAANIFTSYILREFYKRADHWSIFCAWVIAASHIAWAAKEHKLTNVEWNEAFNLASEAARAALEKLSNEALTSGALKPRGPELDDFVRARNTTVAGSIAAWHLVSAKAGAEATSAQAAVTLLRKLSTDGRMWFWGESAIPHFLSVIWFLESTTGNIAPDLMLLTLIGALGRKNFHDSDQALADPYVSADEVLCSLFERIERPPDEPNQKACASFGLEALVLMAVRRLLRQSLKGLWYQLSEVNLAQFRPTKPHELLLWKCSDGKESSRWYARPESWASLRHEAEHDTPEILPSVLQDPAFALMFLLVYPHRMSVALIRHLDLNF
jgi:hypothetical protein